MKPGDSYYLQFTVTSELYEGFIHLSNDRNPLHTNAEFAQSKGFNSQVMHGNILGLFVSYFIGEGLPIKDVAITEQQIKYLKPVYLNDSLSFEAYLIDFFDSVKIAEFKFSFKNADKTEVARGKVQIKVI
jgi:3-hydroxybutyryl-CoA dehydratase